MSLMHEKNAVLKLSLKSTTGYRCEMSAEVSPDQWGRINIILNEDDGGEELRDWEDLQDAQEGLTGGNA